MSDDVCSPTVDLSLFALADFSNVRINGGELSACFMSHLNFDLGFGMAWPCLELLSSSLFYPGSMGIGKTNVEYQPFDD